MNNWSGKIEYLYHNLGSSRTNIGLTTSTLNGAGAADGLKWVAAAQATTRFNGNLVRAGVNYRLNLSGPPPAGL